MYAAIVACNFKAPNTFWKEFSSSAVYLVSFIFAPIFYFINELYITKTLFGNIKKLNSYTLIIYHRELMRLIGVIISVFILAVTILWNTKSDIHTIRIQMYYITLFIAYIISLIIFTSLYELKNEIEKMIISEKSKE